MPVVSRSNNRILPANSRAVDVAKKAIDEITPVFQTRYSNAFKVQAPQGILYTRLEQGIKCTCGATRLNLAARMGQDGKLSEEAITEMVSGVPSKVRPYSIQIGATETSPLAPLNQSQENGDYGTMSDTNSATKELVIPLFSEEKFKDDGAQRNETLDDMVGDFDTSMFGITDISCPCCFGTGFVGGYSVLYGFRKVIPVQDMTFDATGQIDYQDKPWKAVAKSISFSFLIPKGLAAVDACRLLNMTEVVACTITANGMPITDATLLKLAGQIVSFTVAFKQPTIFTHFEFQCAVSTESAYFELPKLNQSADLTLLDSTEPFQILLSPDIPRVFKQDVIVEMKYGKVLVVGAVNDWNTLNMHNLGTEAQVRVAQPEETYSILPRRGRYLTKTQTTVGVHDNKYGQRRT